MHLRDGMKILEVGCAGGLLCHRLKERLPSAEIAGVDFDIGHIEYAKKKTKELGLQCNFVAGDATKLPFEDNMFDKVWTAASDNPLSQIKRFDDRTENYFTYLKAQGFHNISIDAMASVNYAPDCDNVSDEMARAQINEDRVSELCSVEKAYKMAPDALSETEYQTLLNMINNRYDKKIRQYESGKKSWEFRIATTVLISGAK